MTPGEAAAQRRRYFVGYAMALGLSLAAFGLVSIGVLASAWRMGLVAALAALQIGVHLRYFLHLGSGSSRRETVALVVFALVIVTLIVGGSAWIMSDLHDRMM